MRLMLIASGAAAAYTTLARPWHLHWGATEAEIHGPMPGDHLLEDAEASSTRAIDIGAPPAAVWPWLLQLGWHRAGFYAPRPVERVLGVEAGGGSDAATGQDLEVGDRVPLGSNRLAMVVHSVVEPSTLILEREDGRATSSWAIRPTETGCRLLVRDRWSGDRTNPVRLLSRWGAEPLTFALERSALRGIKARAEMLIEHAAGPDALRSTQTAPVAVPGPGGAGSASDQS